LPAQEIVIGKLTTPPDPNSPNNPASISQAADPIPSDPSLSGYNSTTYSLTNCHTISQSLNAILASHHFAANIEWIWVIYNDVLADSQCLAQLTSKISFSQNLVQIGAKHKSAHSNQLLEVGFSVTQSQQYFSQLHTPEIDQGQYDAKEDVFGTAINGSLLKLDFVRFTKMASKQLDCFGESQNFAIKSKMFGRRAIIVPSAVIEHRENFDFAEPFLLVPEIQSQSLYSRYFHQFLIHRPLVSLLILLGLLLSFPIRIFSDRARLKQWAVIPWKMIRNWPAILRARRQLKTNSQLSFSQLKPFWVSNRTYRRFIKDQIHAQRQLELNRFKPTLLQQIELNQIRIRKRLALILFGLILVGVSIYFFHQQILQICLGGNLVSPNLRRTFEPFQSLFNWLIVGSLPLFGIVSFYAAGTLTRRILLRLSAAVIYAFSPISLYLLANPRISAIIFYIVAPLAMAEFLKACGRAQSDLNIPQPPNKIHRALAWGLSSVLLLPGLLNLILAQISGFDVRKFVVLFIDQEAYAPNSMISNTDLVSLLPQHILDSHWKIIILAALALLAVIALLAKTGREFLGILVSMGALVLASIIKNQPIGIDTNSPNYPNDLIYANVTWLQTLALIALLSTCIHIVKRLKPIPNGLATSAVTISALTCFVVLGMNLPVVTQLKVEAANSNTIEAIAAEQQTRPDADNILVIEDADADSIKFSVLNRRNLDYFSTFSFEHINSLVYGESNADFLLRQCVSNLLSQQATLEDYQILIDRQIGGIELPRRLKDNAYFPEIISSLNQIPIFNLMTSTQDFAYWSVDFDTETEG
jgi:GT2 family glycosyltransferase